MPVFPGLSKFPFALKNLMSSYHDPALAPIPPSSSVLTGWGVQSRACREMRAVLMVRAGDHWSFRISRHMAPDCEDMFGCLPGREGGRREDGKREGGSYGQLGLREKVVHNIPQRKAFPTFPSSPSTMSPPLTLLLCLCSVHAPYLGQELHLGRLEGVGGWDVDVNFEDAFGVRRTVGPRDGPGQMVQA